MLYKRKERPGENLFRADETRQRRTMTVTTTTKNQAGVQAGRQTDV
jgi:hypothetical protein